MLGCALGSIACFTWLSSKWSRQAPTTPNPAGGFVHPQLNHGGYIYLSDLQIVTQNFMLWIVAPMFVIAALIQPKKNIRPYYLRWDSDDPNGVGTIIGLASAAITAMLMYSLTRN